MKRMLTLFACVALLSLLAILPAAAQTTTPYSGNISNVFNRVANTRCTDNDRSATVFHQDTHSTDIFALIVQIRQSGYTSNVGSATVNLSDRVTFTSGAISGGSYDLYARRSWGSTARLCTGTWCP